MGLFGAGSCCELIEAPGVVIDQKDMYREKDAESGGGVVRGRVWTRITHRSVPCPKPLKADQLICANWWERMVFWPTGWYELRFRRVKNLPANQIKRPQTPRSRLYTIWGSVQRISQKNWKIFFEKPVTSTLNQPTSLALTKTNRHLQYPVWPLTWPDTRERFFTN